MRMLGLGKAQRPRYPDSCWGTGRDVFAKSAFELSDIMRADARRLILYPPSCRLRSGNAEEISGVVMRRDATICVAAPAFPGDPPPRSPVALELQSTRFASAPISVYQILSLRVRDASEPVSIRAL